MEDLLWLARADNEQPQPGDADLADVGVVVESCVARFGAVAAAHGVELSMQRVGHGPFTVQAQPDLIDRLAGVLIDNACKFAGDEGRVEVSVRDWATRVDLRVDDSGHGIPRISATPCSTASTGQRTRWLAQVSASPSPTPSSVLPRASGRLASRTWEALAWRSPGEKHRRARASPRRAVKHLPNP